MKNNTIIIILFITCAFMSCYAVAENVTVNSAEIARVQVLGDGNFVLHSSASIDPICQGGGKVLHVYANENSVTSAGVKALLSAAMTALAAGNNIDIKYENANSSCFVQQIILNK